MIFTVKSWILSLTISKCSIHENRLSRTNPGYVTISVTETVAPESLKTGRQLSSVNQPKSVTLDFCGIRVKCRSASTSLNTARHALILRSKADLKSATSNITESSAYVIIKHWCLYNSFINLSATRDHSSRLKQEPWGHPWKATNYGIPPEKSKLMYLLLT